MSKDLKFLIELVKGASNLITDEFEVKAKDDKGDLVTNFDYEIEKYMIDKIKSNYPDFSIVSEEYNSNECLTDNCFTIDPIDGTINFAHSIPLWGLQVACIRNKKTCAAVNFAYVACGRFSGTNFVWDTLWDYVPGQFIVEQAGGVIYNNTKMHIAANNEDFLQILKENSSVNTNEEIIISKKTSD